MKIWWRDGQQILIREEKAKCNCQIANSKMSREDYIDSTIHLSGICELFLSRDRTIRECQWLIAMACCN